MSRSNREEDREPNPATLFLEWSPKKGVLQHYDKDKKENVKMKLPFTFIVLDEVATVGGGTKRNNVFEGFWSNAVKNLDDQQFTVKSKNGVEASGLWSQIKDRKGFSFVKGLYIAYKPSKSEPLAIAYLKFQKSSLGAWFDYTKIYRDIYAGAITIQKRSDVINGEMGDYYLPVLAPKPDIPEALEKEALALDANVLRPFLSRYFAKTITAHEENGDGGESQHVERGQYDQTRPENETVYNQADDAADDSDDDGWSDNAAPTPFAPPSTAQTPVPAQPRREVPPANGPQPASKEQGKLATPGQVAAIRKLAQPMGYAEEDIALEYSNQRTQDLTELSMAEAGTCINNLQGPQA